MAARTPSAPPPPVAPMSKDQVEDWLNHEGYPLEFATATAFRAQGFRATQGYHVRDKATEKALEIDVVASHRRSIDDRFLCELSIVAECKYIPVDAPLVVLRSESATLAPFITAATS